MKFNSLLTIPGTSVPLVAVAMAMGCAVETSNGDETEASTEVREDGLTSTSHVSDDVLSRRWPNGVVPYTYEVVSNPKYPDTSNYPMWFDARRMWRELTGGAVRFVPRTDEATYIHILFDGDNSTNRLRGTKKIADDTGDLVMEPISGRWDIHIRARDAWKVNHELGHVLGLFHQQRHPNSGRCVGLKAGTPQQIPSKYFVGDYFKDSVMHYHECDAASDKCDFSWWTTNADDCPSTLDWHDPPSDLDILAVRKMYGANAEYFNDTDWCSGQGQSVYLGDFDGDGLDDLLCHDKPAGARFVDYADPDRDDVFADGDWSNTSHRFCRASDRTLYVGDFDGDGRDDLLCHDASDGRRFIDHANSSGRLYGTDSWPSGNFCSGANRQLYVGDFDGDGKADQLCHDKDSGIRSVDYARNGFAGADWTAGNAWCTASDRYLIVGDFSGDGRDDLICHDGGSGHRWIDYASGSGQLWGANWSSKSDGRAATFCHGEDERLNAADVDGDGRDDLVCHDAYSGTVSVDLAMSSAWSEGSRLWGSNYGAEYSFCNSQDARLLVGDLPSGRPGQSLFCHNGTTGHQMARYSY